uniref:Uncharacterized protein n=1 Tax=viral metagenome TaxID=1070528 RepID=A0A6H2A126_9ZZZZ
MKIKFHKFSGNREVYIHLYKNNKLCNSDMLSINKNNKITLDNSPSGNFIYYGEKGVNFNKVFIGVKKVEFTSEVFGRYDELSKYLELWQIVDVYLK